MIHIIIWKFLPNGFCASHCQARVRHALCTRKDKQNRSRVRKKNAGREDKEGRAVHCKKRYAVFPSPAGISLTKLSLAGKHFNYPRQKKGRVW
jgi:hypothetical protein